MSRPQLWDLFARHPIADAVFPYLTLADVYRLHGVCKSLYSVVLDLQDRQLNINAALKDFVKSCDSFRYNLGKAEALIVGGFVINFLGYRQHDNTFLDILVERGPLSENLIQHLCVEEAYQNLGSYEVGKPVMLTRPEFATNIRVTKTEKTPVHTLLEGSYTTADLCFMSWNKVYSIFPLETFVYHQFWPLRKLDDAFGARLAELAKQGWTTRDLVWADLAEKLLSGLGLRRVGDENSLVMPLMPVLACTGLNPDYVLELSEFSVDTRTQAQPPFRGTGMFGSHAAVTRKETTISRELCVTLEELKSQSLRHRYTTGEGSDWHAFARKRLHRWTEVEGYKMDHDKRPADFPESPLPSDFEVPATWDFADDQMPIWYRTFCL